MKDDAQAQNSFWLETASLSPRPSLIEKTRTDVCIVGGGIAGLTTAYLLARERKSVVVLDDGAVGGGMTARTTAHLSNAYDDRYFEIERLHGLEAARLTAQSHTAAINKVEEIVKAEKIDCDFERLDGFLFTPPGESAEVLEKELEAVYRAGLVEVKKVPWAPISSFDTGAALRFPHQAQFHPLKYLNGLAKAILRDGGQIFEQTHVTKVEGGSSAWVETANGSSVDCDAIVIATNSPVNDLVAIHTKQSPYVTYVIGARIPKGSAVRALYWDTLDPYHYVRIHTEEGSSSDLLIVGGEDHKTGQANDGERRYQRLLEWSRLRFPQIQEVEFRWSGQVMEPVDALAFIGRNPLDADNVYIATGDSGQGMTHGTIAGILITDLIQGRENPWQDLYNPSRITLRSLPEYAGENIKVAEQFADHLTAGEVQSVDDIKPCTGAIMRDGLLKIAVYKDSEGKIHRLSAICKHLGCVVAWNSTEETWDCPCHGSRYSAVGRVYQGPANTDLSSHQD